MLVRSRLSWLIGELAADSSIRVFAGCWFGHDRSISWKIWELAAVSGSLLAAGWVMMVVNHMVSGGWQEHQDFGWLLGVGLFFWPMKNQERGSRTRSSWSTEGPFCRFQFFVILWFCVWKMRILEFLTVGEKCWRPDIVVCSSGVLMNIRGCDVVICF